VTAYRNICAECGLEVPNSRWYTPLTVVENNRAKILRDFKFQTDKQLLANQPDIVMADKVVTDVAIPADSKTRKKEHGKIWKYRELKKQRVLMWKVKSTMIRNRRFETGRVARFVVDLSSTSSACVLFNVWHYVRSARHTCRIIQCYNQNTVCFRQFRVTILYF